MKKNVIQGHSRNQQNHPRGCIGLVGKAIKRRSCKGGGKQKLNKCLRSKERPGTLKIARIFVSFCC